MKNLINMLDARLSTESLPVATCISKYALPEETSYPEYEERYREYCIFGGKRFTILIRKTGDVFWVRCGYKTSPDDPYVGGIENRDISSSNELDIVEHCVNNFNALLDKKGW